jgi:hypothetical protein
MHLAHIMCWFKESNQLQLHRSITYFLFISLANLLLNLWNLHSLVYFSVILNISSIHLKNKVVFKITIWSITRLIVILKIASFFFFLCTFRITRFSLLTYSMKDVSIFCTGIDKRWAKDGNKIMLGVHLFFLKKLIIGHVGLACRSLWVL